jgi:hypothetical protein
LIKNRPSRKHISAYIYVHGSDERRSYEPVIYINNWWAGAPQMVHIYSRLVRAALVRAGNIYGCTDISCRLVRAIGFGPGGQNYSSTPVRNYLDNVYIFRVALSRRVQRCHPRGNRSTVAAVIMSGCLVIIAYIHIPALLATRRAHDTFNTLFYDD